MSPSRRFLRRALAISSLVGCGYDFGGVVFEDPGGGGSSTTAVSSGGGPSSSGTASSGSSAASAGGAGGADGGGGGSGGGDVLCEGLPCPSVECFDTTCADGRCVLSPLDPGARCGPTDEQFCDQALTCVACMTTDDCAVPPSSCRAVACEDGQCLETVILEGRECAGGPAGRGVCTAGEVCVECVGPAQCAVEEQCVRGACAPVPESCGDGLENGDESDLDCGGSCPSCDNGKVCDSAGDCASRYCDANFCAACDRSECGADRWCDGGTCTPRKALGASCTAAGQCESEACSDGVCCDSTCAGACEACASTLTGLTSGACEPVLVGIDPDDDCAEGECVTGACDGARACGVVEGPCTGSCAFYSGKYYFAQGVCSAAQCEHSDVQTCPEGFMCNAAGTACENTTSLQ